MIKFILTPIIALTFQLWAADIPIESTSHNEEITRSLQDVSIEEIPQSLSHLVTQSLSHSVTQSLSHSVTQSLSHSVT